MHTLLADLLLNDRGFAFDPMSGETYQLNTTGLALVRWLQQGCAPEQLLERLQEQYEIDEHSARRDIEGFLEEIEQLGWER